MSEALKKYIPGVCNIGRTEMRKRRRVGLMALVATGLFWWGAEWLEVLPKWRVLLFFPATLAAAGLLQWLMGFCAAFGLSGVFKMGTDEDKTDTVAQAEFRAKDRHKAWVIIVASALVGVLTAYAAYVV
ncbi:hypothetical protein FEM03_03330 [Phragmitibacter flavus]|uniref:Uncharacterized protein n=1 Tax=Phragmitibacter flavus TaxID=2576071 RepID=A0A5R8KJB8_9BACT|nr:hypothetical protein [Phragmitibacter flavus]TLD72404.1 hypothetical protein FEM03_03330 [Phragmitibacter flavus]